MSNINLEVNFKDIVEKALDKKKPDKTTVHDGEVEGSGVDKKKKEDKKDE